MTRTVYRIGQPPPAEAQQDARRAEAEAVDKVRAGLHNWQKWVMRDGSRRLGLPGQAGYMPPDPGQGSDPILELAMKTEEAIVALRDYEMWLVRMRWYEAFRHQWPDDELARNCHLTDRELRRRLRSIYLVMAVRMGYY